MRPPITPDSAHAYLRPPPPRDARAPEMPPTFHLALTLAGTVSAAAYTAGVVDFLIEALDSWERAKDEAPGDVPNHRVVLHAISGTSGGGIVAAIAAATLFRPFTPVRHPDESSVVAPAAPLNRLYDTWVRAIDMTKLLALDGLARPGKPQSLLNSGAIDAVARDVLDMAPYQPGSDRAFDGRRRKWVAEHLHVFTTSANLRGVPYRITFTGTTGLGYPMMAHFNYQHFLVSASDPAGDWLVRLDPATIGPGAAEAPGWCDLVAAAKATSAFPIGLKARMLSHTKGFYDEVRWPYPDENRHIAFTAVTPDWYVDTRGGAEPLKEPVEFLNVDGGALNNEPFELARVTLSGLGGRNPRDALEADRAVIMIDPLFRPDDGADPVDSAGNPVIVDGKPVRGRIARRNDPSLFAVLGSLVGSLVANARFKGDELALAADETVFSRFLVTPRAPAIGGAYDTYPIFGELMGAFAAFFHRDLREYDYRLGRRNAQAFLRHWFALPEGNPLFDGWSEGGQSPLIEKFAVRRGGKPLRIQKFVGGQPQGQPSRLVPIVPLVGDLDKEIRMPDRAPLVRRLDFAFYEPDIKWRLDALFRKLKEEVAGRNGGGVWGWIKSRVGAAYLDFGWIAALRGVALGKIKQEFELAAKQAKERLMLIKRAERAAAAPKPMKDGWHHLP